MDANSCTISRFKAQANKFSGILSKGLGKTTGRLIKELVYGIQASKDIKISNVARSLQEDIKLIKTEERLCRNLAAEDFSEHINQQIIRLGDDKITDEMVIAIDPGDIMKPYAKAMEKLCGVYDGSAGVGAQGYHLCQVTAANLEHNKIVPLYCEAYSSLENNFVSGTEKIKEAINKVIAKTGTAGIWAIDRQGDCNEIIEHFTANKLKFVTRLKLNRWLLTKNKNGGIVPVQADRLETHASLNYKAQITKIEDGKETVINITFGIKKVALHDKPNEWFNVVIIKGFGQHPMLLLTSLEPMNAEPKEVYKIVETYLTRWKCDECYRYIKQSYNLEDIRVRSYNGIRNMVAIINAIAYFTSIYMGMNLKMKLMVQKVFILSKRFFGIPSFFHYAMADGIFELLKKTNCGIFTNKKKDKSADDIILSLFPD
jgi:hypothetical protein